MKFFKLIIQESKLRSNFYQMNVPEVNKANFQEVLAKTTCHDNMYIYIYGLCSDQIYRSYKIKIWIVTTCCGFRPAGCAMAGPRSGPGRDAGRDARDAVTERRAVWEALAMGEEILVRAANTITFNWQEQMTDIGWRWLTSDDQMW